MTESGADIVARLERLATKMFQSGNWGRDLDTVKDAMSTIVDLRVELHRATEEAAEAADRIEELEANLAKAVEAGVDVSASLNAAISLLERGGKRAAASDKMFAQMLVDYNASLDRFRTTLAELTGGKDE